MADVNGITVRQHTLTVNQVDKVEFPDKNIRKVAVSLIGSGSVTLKANGVLSNQTDVSGIVINEDIPGFTFERNSNIEYLTVVSDSTAVIQWDFPNG